MSKKTSSSPQNLKIGYYQASPLLGAVAQNKQDALEKIKEATKENIDLLVFPELFICGYPPEDLVLKPSFYKASMEAIIDIANALEEAHPAVLIGSPRFDEGKLYNSVALLNAGEPIIWRDKVHLPNYGVFDERRVFTSGVMPSPIDVKGISIGVPICEDLWERDVALHLKQKGAQILVSPNGSPYWENKSELRYKVMRARIKETSLPLIYINRFGGQDELVFDGGSFILDAEGALIHQGVFFQEESHCSSWVKEKTGLISMMGEGKAYKVKAQEPLDLLKANYQACVTGLRDYVNNNHFKDVVLGLSGGIDSALVAAMAVDALGCERVHAIMMPYTYTAQSSLDDAKQCADLLKIRYDIIPIAKGVEASFDMLAPLFEKRAHDITEENIQSRLRGLLLMAVSNKLGSMVLTTGNKSEMSVGYATLYGDMNGGFNPLKDLYKTNVFELARWRNAHYDHLLKGPEGLVIPSNIITKPPTAELREDQKDEDSLPPYDILDTLLQGLVEEECSTNEMIKKGFDKELVYRIEHLLYIAEYKRRQSAPGVKISRKHFGRDRRYPITNAWRDRP